MSDHLGLLLDDTFYNVLAESAPPLSEFVEHSGRAEYLSKVSLELKGDFPHKSALLDRGFFVSKTTGSKRSFGEIFYNLYNEDKPVFISSDAILHAWHKSFDSIVMMLETEYFLPTLKSVLKEMLARLVSVAPTLEAASTHRALLSDVEMLLLVALSLISYEEPQTHSRRNPFWDEVDQPVQKAATDTTTPATPPAFCDPSAVSALLRMCHAATGSSKIAIFGTQFEIDFSRMKPRGHYEKSAKLKSYFMACSWLGLLLLRIEPGPKGFAGMQSALFMLSLLRQGRGAPPTPVPSTDSGIEKSPEIEQVQPLSDENEKESEGGKFAKFAHSLASVFGKSEKSAAQKKPAAKRSSRWGPPEPELEVSGDLTTLLHLDSVLISLFGKSDNMTFDELNSLVDELDPSHALTVAELISPDFVAQVQAKVAKHPTLGLQSYNTEMAQSPFGLDDARRAELPRVFGFFGQRATIDGWVMSKLMHDQILDGGKKVPRVLTSLHDVCYGVLGNTTATATEITRRISAELDYSTHKGQMRDGLPFHHNLMAAKQSVDALPKNVWTSDVYSAWLHTLRALSEPTTDAKYPQAMRTEAWAQKNLSTQMGGFIELKHDTILYAKPPVPMMCGCDFPYGYVEPCVEFWERMIQMSLLTKSALANFYNLFEKQSSSGNSGNGDVSVEGGLKTKTLEFFQRFADTVSVLKRISVKELEKIPISPEENTWLRQTLEDRVGGSGMGSFTGWYYTLFWRWETAINSAGRIVTDITSAPPDPILGTPGCVLHAALGNPAIMTFVADYCGAVPHPATRMVQKQRPDSHWGEMEQVKLPPETSATPLISGDICNKTMAFYGPVFSVYEFTRPWGERLTDGEWREMIESSNPNRFVYYENEEDYEKPRPPVATVPSRPDFVKSFFVE